MKSIKIRLLNSILTSEKNPQWSEVFQLQWDILNPSSECLKPELKSHWEITSEQMISILPSKWCLHLSYNLKKCQFLDNSLRNLINIRLDKLIKLSFCSILWKKLSKIELFTKKLWMVSMSLKKLKSPWRRLSSRIKQESLLVTTWLIFMHHLLSRKNLHSRATWLSQRTKYEI